MTGSNTSQHTRLPPSGIVLAGVQKQPRKVLRKMGLVDNDALAFAENFEAALALCAVAKRGR